MNALFSIIQTIGIFLAGLVVRFGLLVAVLLVLTAIFLVGLGIVRLAGALRRRVLGLSVADGVSWKRQGYYAPGHTWVASVRGQAAIRVGFDDVAQHVLGHVTAVTFPSPGTKVQEGEPLAEVTCANGRAVIPAPAGGTVLAFNNAVIDDPTLIHRDPYRRGWLVSLEPANTAYTRLLWGDAAKRWLREESNRWSRVLEEQLQLHAADGGELTAPGASLLNAEQWNATVRSFLKTEG
jgi:glycine cleavage system H lipoate-binding protein